MAKVTLGNFIERVSIKASDLDDYSKLEALGVSNVDGITKTGHVKSADLAKYLYIQENYFAYNPYRINVGSIGLTPKNVKGLVSPAYIVFKTKETLKPELLFDFLKSFDGIQQINKLAKGTVRKTLSFENLSKIELIVPDINKQERILSLKLNTQSIHNNLENEIVIQQNLLTKLKQSVLQDAIEGKLTAKWREENQDIESASTLLEKIQKEKVHLIKNKKLKKAQAIKNVKTMRDINIPQNWRWAKGDELFFTTKLAGFEYTDHMILKDDGEVPVIRAQNVRPYNIKTDTLKYIDMDTSLKLHRCALTKPALLITFIGAGIGDVALFNEQERWHLAPNVAKQEQFEGCEDLISLKYINHYLMSNTGKKELFKHVKATAQPSLSMGTIRDIDFPIPPIEEQQEIVNKIEKLFAKCDELEEQINNSKQNTQTLMQSVLKEAFEK